MKSFSTPTAQPGRSMAYRKAVAFSAEKKEETMNVSKINRDERQELLRMLGNLNSYGNRRAYKDRPLPRELRKWQKKITAWHSREREMGSRFTRQWDKKVADIRQEIYFGTAARALALMKALKA